MSNSFSKEHERLQKRMMRQKIHRIWQTTQSGNVNNLNEEEKQLAHIMLEHKEYDNDFCNAEDLFDYEYDPDTEINPFMHISVHSAIENQLTEQEPTEVCEFYEAMREKGVSQHAIIHQIGLIFVPLVFHTMVHSKPFDSGRYKRLLKKYKDTDPEMLEALLEKEFKP